MASSQFAIKILKQGWLDMERPEYDLCSHGTIELIIGGQTITSGEMEYGITESALALLRTLFYSHNKEHPVAEMLIFHGCGFLWMMSCPIGINWNVIHAKDGVMLDNIIRYDDTNVNNGVRFNNLIARVSERDYRQQIIDFAIKAKQPFIESPRSFSNEDDKQVFKAFWEEYDELLKEAQNMAKITFLFFAKRIAGPGKIFEGNIFTRDVPRQFIRHRGTWGRLSRYLKKRK